MNADRLLALYKEVAEAPDAIARLRRFVLLWPLSTTSDAVLRSPYAGRWCRDGHDPHW